MDGKDINDGRWQGWLLQNQYLLVNGMKLLNVSDIEKSWGCTGQSSAQAEIEIFLQIIYIRLALKLSLVISKHCLLYNPNLT